MGVISVIVYSLLLTVLCQCPEVPNCEDSTRICEAKQIVSYRYILYDVAGHEGFNLRRDVYTRIAPLINRLNKEFTAFKYFLVLPAWDQLPHWRSGDSIIGSQRNLPWSLFFNLKSLRNYAPVLELYEFLEDYKGEHLDHVFKLQHSADLWTEKFTWIEKWAVEDCRGPAIYYRDEANIYRNIKYPDILSSKTFHCLSFQGPASLIVEILNSFGGEAIRFEHAEIMLPDYYGDPEHWKCRESMKFSDDLVKIATNFRMSYLGMEKLEVKYSTDKFFEGDPYLCVHLRRRDFLMNRPKFTPSLDHAASQIKQKLENLTLNKVFVATDTHEDELRRLSEMMLPFKIVRYEPTSDVVRTFKDGGVAIIEQIICSYAQYFIGSHESTFSYRIREEREILNFHPDSTFNRLCGNTEEYCEQPTRWLRPR